MSEVKEVGPGTELRITRPEPYAAPMNAGYDDTQARDGHYVIVKTTAADAIRKMLRNECHAGDFFDPGECVDVEVKYGHYMGRFRINHAGKLIRLPGAVRKTSGFDGPNLLDAARQFIKHIRTMPDDNPKSRHLGLALNNRPGELLEEAVAALTPAPVT
jgi:hypothetical protein